MPRTLHVTVPLLGNPDGCGCLKLNALIDVDRVGIICNECDVEVRIVAAAQLRQTLTGMELTLDICNQTEQQPTPHRNVPALQEGERVSRVLAHERASVGSPGNPSGFSDHGV